MIGKTNAVGGGGSNPCILNIIDFTGVAMEQTDEGGVSSAQPTYTLKLTPYVNGRGIISNPDFAYREYSLEVSDITYRYGQIKISRVTSESIVNRIIADSGIEDGIYYIGLSYINPSSYSNFPNVSINYRAGRHSIYTITNGVATTSSSTVYVSSNYANADYTADQVGKMLISYIQKSS